MLYAVPAVQALSVGVADAASLDGGTPPEGPGQDEPALLGQLPSHGVFVVEFGGGRYAYQVSHLGGLGTPGEGNDVAFLDERLGVGTYVLGDSPDSTAWSTLLARIASGIGEFVAADGATYRAILVSIPSDATALLGASYVFDGSFQADPDGDKWREAQQQGATLYFIKP